MSRIKIYLLIFIVISFLKNETFASSKKFITPIFNGPTEFKLMVDFLQRKSESDEEISLFQKSISKMDPFASLLNKDELHFTIKTEIYKGILKKYKNAPIEKANVNLALIQECTKKAEELKNKKKIHTFSYWVISALISDAKYLLTDPSNLNFLRVYKAGEQGSDKNFPIWKRKLNMVVPWLVFFEGADEIEFESMIKNIHLETLRVISQYLLVMVQNSRFDKNIDIRPSKFSNLKSFKWIEEKAALPKYPDENISKQNSSSPSEDIKGWVPKDKPNDLNQPKAAIDPAPDPNYVPPANLPKPVNDWMESI